MKNFEFLYLIGGIISLVLQFLTIVACALLFSKNRTLGTILMLLGSFLTVIFYGLSIFGTQLMAQKGAEQVTKTSGLFNLLGQIPHFLFVLGLLLFIVKYRKKEGVQKNPG